MNADHRFSVKERGFTLVELVVSICIASIVAAFIVVFIRTPVENYIAESRRTELITEADLIERTLAQDIRNALPNSTRRDPTGQILEMVPAADMAIYRAVGTESPAVPNNELSFGAPDTQFNTLGIFSQTTVACCGIPVQIPFQIVIGQDQASASQDLYRGGSVITPATTSVSISRQITPPPPKSIRIDAVTLGSAFTFNWPSPNKHAFLVANPVSAVAYVCDTNTHTLKRYERYPVAAGIAANRNAAARIGTVSNDVNFCDFNRTLSTTTRGDLVTINIQLTRAGETQTVFVQKAVENLP